MTDDQLAADFEKLPSSEPKDETDFGLRAYVTRISEDKLAQYDPAWPDEQLVEWDGNFKNDNSLMLVCCERDVGPPEFRKVLEDWLEFRKSR
jgi:hypothetical protein